MCGSRVVRVLVVLKTNSRRSECRAPYMSLSISLTLEPMYRTAHRQRWSGAHLNQFRGNPIPTRWQNFPNRTRRQLLSASVRANGANK